MKDLGTQPPDGRWERGPGPTWRPAPWRAAGPVLLGLLLAWGGRAQAQEESVNLDDLLQSGQEFLEQNADPDLLKALQGVNQDQAQQLFQALQQRFQGQYVIDLAPLKQTATTLLPVLAQNQTTRPYAEWLQSQMDYLQVADTLRLTIPPPTVEPGQPPPPRPNPTPAVERKVWRQQLAQRPLPTGAAPYVSRLKPVFTAQGVPPQLVWMAEVESSFHPEARSPVGAAGLFQLMPRTARSLGLALRPEDQRLEPEPSARATAKYLNYLYGRFKDWPLVMAAYNAGEGNVRNLLTKHRARTFDQIAPHLPAETQMYVPRIDATLLRREGVGLSQLQAPKA